MIPCTRACDVFDAHAGDKADKVNTVDGNIIDRSAVLAFLKIPHRTASVLERVLCRHIDTADLAERAVCNHFTEIADAGRKAQGQIAADTEVLLGCQRFDFIKLG